MARLSRVTQKIFAASAANNGVFGSAQANAGPGTISNVLATIMGLPAWGAGWLSAIMGSSKFPPLEEIQALEYVHSAQIAYLLNQGIAEYDAGTTYYTNQICAKAGTYQLYGSITNGNLGNALTDAANWVLLADFGVPIGASFTNVLAADVNLTSIGTFFTGPTVSAGTTGKFLVTGSVTLVDTVAAGFSAVLTDGTTVIASGAGYSPNASNSISIALSGIITNPAGNIRINAADGATTGGKIKGGSNLSLVNAVRIG
jgi:hypothetical protein